MTQTALFGFGLQLISAIAVPGALAQADDAAEGIRIALTEPDPAEPRSGFWREAGLIAYRHGGVTFRCNADQVTVAIDRGVDPIQAGRLLVANALPAMLWQRGALMLHAATVIPAGCNQAVALIGASGCGKSSVALAALDQGAELIGDDSLAIAADGDPVVGAGLPGGCFIRTAAGANRRFVAAAPGPRRGVAPLAAIVVLDHRAAGAVPLRLDPVAAVEALLARCHRPVIPALCHWQGEVLRQISRLAQTVPVHAWAPGDPAALFAQLALR